MRPSPWRESGRPPDDMSMLRVIAPTNYIPLGYRVPSTASEASGRLAIEGFKAAAAEGAAILLPLTVGGGALIGWLRGVPEEASRNAEAVVLDTWQKIDISTGLARDLSRAGASRRALQWTVNDPTGATQTPDQTMVRNGEYWLLVQPVEVKLSPNPSGRMDEDQFVNPRLHLVMKTNCSVIRAQNAKEVATISGRYVGPGYNFMKWSEEGGRRLVGAISEGQIKLAEQILDELFAQ